MKNRISFLLMFLTIIFLFGCRAPERRRAVKVPYDNPLPQGQNALRKIINLSEIPDFTVACLDLTDLRSSIDNSLNYLKKPSSLNFFPSSGISHDLNVNSLRAFAELLDSGLTGRKLQEAIIQKFDVYESIGCDGYGTVLYTGYYTPIFEGSLQRSRQFRYPLYKMPSDLVKSPDGEILGQRLPGGTVRPYPSRTVIEDTGMLKGNELIWLSDPFEAYIAHVQGSAKIRLPKGELITVGYAANNGYEYRSVAEELVRDGKITGEKISLAAMIDYFKVNPEQINSYIRRNPRFVFFRIEEGPPLGSLNEPVTPMRSIATDKSIFPRGALTFISTTLPRVTNGAIINRAYSGFALDQDTGGAIRAPGRCDVYMGQGETAGKLAGQTYQEGRLYYLFLK